MGVSLENGKRGAIAEVNVVPLIDVLLVLLIIFMVISPRVPVGLAVVLPEPAEDPGPSPGVVVVQVLADGSLRINSEPVIWHDFQDRLEAIFKLRANRVAFVRADSVLEFAVVARAIDVMRGSGITSVGLMTPELENSR